MAIGTNKLPRYNIIFFARLETKVAKAEVVLSIDVDSSHWWLEIQKIFENVIIVNKIRHPRFELYSNSYTNKSIRSFLQKKVRY